jgi:hypothetical protein
MFVYHLIHHETASGTRWGAVGSTFTYTPYGALKASTGALATPLLFAQSYSDNATGLLYLVNRYYDPTTASTQT